MPLGKRQRKFLLGLCLGFAGILLLWLGLPLWFPWVLRPVAASYGANYARYERQGYGRLVLDQVTFTNRNIKLRAEHIESVAPTIWLWRRAFGNTKGTFVRVKVWQLELNQSGAGKSRPGSVPSIPEIVEQTDAVFRALKSWIPSATLSNGAVLLPQARIELPSVGWTKGDLRVTTAGLKLPELNQFLAGLSFGEMTNLMLAASLGRPQPWEVKIKSDPLRFKSTIRISTNAFGVGVQSTMSWWSNQIALDAEFGRKGLVPDKANLRAPELHLSGEQVLFRDYSEVTGSIAAQWSNGQFLVDISGSAVPVATRTNFPPIELNLHASGDTDSAVIHTAVISSPWLRAELSKDFKLFFTGQFVRDPAAASLWLDFSKQPWLPVEGVLTGNAQIKPGEGKFPTVQFHLEGSEFGSKDLKASAIETEGNLTWPLLEILRARGTFDDGSSAEAQGGIDFDKQAIAGGRLELNGGLVQRWLPAGYSYGGLGFAGLVDGPFQSLNYSGHLDLTNFTSPELEPLQLRADWSGQQMNVESASLLISAGTSSLALRGALAIGTSGTNLTLQALTLMKDSKPLLALEKPAMISVNHDAAPKNNWLVHIDSFDWRGSAGQVQAQGRLDWPLSGGFTASIKNVRSGIADDFLKSRSEPFEIHSLKAVGGWTNGPLIFAVDGSGSMRFQKDLPLSASLDVHGDAQGITISNLVVTSQTSSVAIAHGFLPVSFDPSATTNRFHLHTREAFHLIAITEPQSVLWEKIAGWTGLGMVAPNLRLDVGGTLQAPQGVIRFEASQIKFRAALTNIPALDDIDLAVDLDHQAARIKECQFLVQGQPVRLNGEIPLGESFWSRDTKLPDWRAARAHVTIQNAQLAAFTPIFPDLLSPQGELNLEVEMQPGAKFEGSLSISHGRTRPLAALGPIRDIAVNLGLHGYKVSLDSATADIGGAEVAAKGQADLERMDWRRLTMPPFKFVLRGTNVPLSRQPESIIRSDLDLTVTKTNDTPALVSGTAHLRNSFFLHDLADLVPGKVASPSRRPPYFSIEAEPLAGWRLAVHVSGERFLKVRSPIFNGEVSANLNLQGTLKEPSVLGEVRVDSGLVRFPFANLKVQQGFVTLTSQDPYRPHLVVTAGSKQYGYDIKMEVSGPADAPILQFTSTPPLSSEQILLMVTAGELPRLERSLSTQQRAETLALFVGKDLLTRLGFGDEKEQRLTLHSGEQLSDQGRPTYNVEYQVTDRWSIVGEYDRFNAFNAGLKWRIYSK